MDTNQTKAFNDGAVIIDGAADIDRGADMDGGAVIDGAADIDGGAVIDSSSEKTDKSGAGRFTFSQIHKYLDNGTYPNSFDKSNKQALRKRSKYFKIVDGTLYYIGGGKHNSV